MNQVPVQKASMNMFAPMCTERKVAFLSCPVFLDRKAEQTVFEVVIHSYMCPTNPHP